MYSSLITLHTSPEYLQNLRRAGKIVATLLDQLIPEWLKTGMSCKEIDVKIEEYILAQGAQPTFKGYRGHGKIPFPAASCCSINKQLVHGIPSDHIPKAGDLISFDLGATVGGAIADAARTYEVNTDNHSKLLNACKSALNEAIRITNVGTRIGSLGEKISQVARKHDLGVITNYGGHGISVSSLNQGIPHASPFICNEGKGSNGIRIQAGNVLAIEPLFVYGIDTTTKVEADGWTVSCNDLCAHFEHTIYVHKDRTEIITLI